MSQLPLPDQCEPGVEAVVGQTVSGQAQTATETSSQQLAAVFKALSEPVRLRILYLMLQRGELCVCDIVDSLDLSQSVVSRHLAYLRNHQLVSTRRDGVWVYYQISAASAFVEQVLAVFSASASSALDLQADLQKVIDSEGKGCC